MWSQLELHTVGIPYGDDHKGCKILVTSRRMSVCSDMGAQKYFPINFLSEEESWSLFTKNLPQVEHDEFQALAKEINKKCAGLPLLIEIVAKDLRRRKEVHAWKTKLSQLYFDGLDTKVSKVLRSSYYNLENDETKAFFLLCGIFGQSNIYIEYLVRYCVGMKLFKSPATIKDTTNKVLTFIGILKEECLLLDGDKNDSVKMHDLVRDTARSISFEEQNAFIGMTDAELERWPDKDCTRISMHHCKISGTLQSWDCPKAELLLFSTEDPSLKISDSFFEGIKKLKVLDLSGLRFLPMPYSFGSLTNLHTLCLHQCELDDIAIIRELKQLWVLSLVGSKIVKLPTEMEQLTQLKSLDLTDCSELRVFQANVLSKLSLLEELYMKNCFILEGVEGKEILTELSSLSHLTSLEINVANDMTIPKALADQLQMYKILIGENFYWDQWSPDSSNLLKLETSIDVEYGDGVKLLLQKAEEADLKGVLPDLFDGDGFPQLKHLSVRSSQELRCIINSTTTKSVFPKLETLGINDLENLEEICHGRLTDGCFEELRSLEVEECPRLKHLSIIKSSFQLEELEVWNCAEMKEVIIRESEEKNEVFEFTQLRTLVLSGLPQLVSFSDDKEESESNAKSSLFNKKVAFPNLERLILWDLEKLNNIWDGEISLNCFSKVKSLEIGGCGSLTKIFPSHAIKCFQKLQQLKIHSCDSVEVIFEIKEGNPRMTLELRNLEKLNNIWVWDGEIPLNSFSKLEYLEIDGGGRLTKIFPSHAIQCFQKLQSLSVNSCFWVEVIYEIEEGNNVSTATPTPFELRDLEISYMRSLKQIWSKDPKGVFTFQNLQSVYVWNCPCLKYVFPASIAARDLSNLKKLEISTSSVEEIVEMAGEGEDHCFNFPKLTFISLVSLDKIKSFYPGTHSIKLPILKDIYIRECPKIVLFGFSNVDDSDRDQPQPLLSVDKVNNFSNLEHIEIGNNEFKYFPSVEFSIDRFPKLKSISLGWLRDESPHLLPGFLKRLCSLSIQTLVVEGSDLKEVLFSNEGVVNDTFVLPVKELRLLENQSLKHIWKEDSQLKSLCKNLHSLDIRSCWQLTNIAPSFSSFENLAILNVDNCGGLRNLITTSTAKTMVQLKEIVVSNCWNMTEIVANDTEEKDTIIFSKLTSLYLWDLNNLANFCSADHSFHFPCLENVQVSYCTEMKTFCPGDVSTAKLSKINWNDNSIHLKGSINETIALLFNRRE